MDRIANGCRDSLDRNEQKLCGGANRDRTGDLLNAIQALSQLSYSPTFMLQKVIDGKRCLDTMLGKNVSSFFLGRLREHSFPISFLAKPWRLC